jgi:hypothetical protein
MNRAGGVKSPSGHPRPPEPHVVGGLAPLYPAGGHPQMAVASMTAVAILVNHYFVPVIALD